MVEVVSSQSAAHRENPSGSKTSTSEGNSEFDHVLVSTQNSMAEDSKAAVAVVPKKRKNSVHGALAPRKPNTSNEEAATPKRRHSDLSIPRTPASPVSPRQTDSKTRPSLRMIKNTLGAIRRMQKGVKQDSKGANQEEDANEDYEVTGEEKMFPEHLKRLHELMQEYGEAELVCSENELESEGNAGMYQVFDILQWLSLTDEEEEPTGEDKSRNKPKAPPLPRNSSRRHSGPAAVGIRNIGKSKFKSSPGDLGQLDTSTSDSDWSNISEPEEAERQGRGKSGNAVSTEPVLPVSVMENASKCHVSTEPALPVAGVKKDSSQDDRQKAEFKPRMLQRRASAGDAGISFTDAQKPVARPQQRHGRTGSKCTIISSSEASTAPAPLPSIQDLAQDRARKEKLLADMNQLAVKAGLALDRKSSDVKPEMSTFDVAKLWTTDKRRPRRKSWAFSTNLV